MAYVNSPPNPLLVPPSQRHPKAILASAKVLSLLFAAPLRARIALSIAALLTILVALLAISPPYRGLAGFELSLCSLSRRCAPIFFAAR